MDREALFGQLLSDCQGRLRAIARSFAHQDADDLFQEIVLQIWRSLPAFRGESAGRTWCYRVALNTAMNWSRSGRARRRHLPIDNGYSAGAIPASSPRPAAPDSNAELLERLLAEQTPADRAILLLLLDDVSYTAMAEILGTSEGALRVRVHRIKARLRQQYEGVSDEL